MESETCIIIVITMTHRQSSYVKCTHSILPHGFTFRAAVIALGEMHTMPGQDLGGAEYRGGGNLLSTCEYRVGILIKGVCVFYDL